MNAKEKAIIEAIINKSDKIRHQVALEILLVGKSCRRENDTYSIVTRNAVKQAFSGWRYSQFQDDEIYNTFLVFFIPYIESIDSEKFRNIENLKGWLFRVAYNCANTNRENINKALGINIEDNENVQFPIDDGCIKNEEVQENNETMGFNPAEESEIEWFDKLIKQYVKELPIERDRVIVKAVMLDEIDRKELSKELGITPSALNLAFEEAWIRVLKRALPDIRYRARKMFTIFEFELFPADAEILRRFFTGATINFREQLEKMSREDSCSQEKMETKIAKAYKKLLRINKAAKRNKNADYQGEISAEEKNKLIRMYRKKSNKAILYDTNLSLAVLLGKFFDNYDGDLIEMSINEHEPMEEMTQKINLALQLLKEINNKNA